MTIVADTGPLYALIDSDDAWHERVIEWWSANSSPIVVPVTVLPEICYLLRSRISTEAEAAFVRAVEAGEFVVEPIDQEDIVRADTIIGKYEDLGFVDATVVAAAERLDATEILTTDRRHFSQVRPRHTRAFTLSP